MAISVVGSTTTFSSAGTQTPTVSVPTGVTTGDYLFAWLSYSGDSIPAPPSGWTELVGVAGSTTARFSLIVRTMASGVTQAQWTIPVSGTGTYAKMEAAMIAVRGVASYTLGTVYNRAASGSTSALPGVTVATGGMALAFAGDRTSSQTSVTAPTGMTEQAKYVQNSGGGGSVLIASTSTAGATGTETVTYGVASSNAVGALVNLAATSGTVPVVSAGAAQSVGTGTTVTLSGTATGATSVAWTQTNGPTPAPTITSATSNTATVTPTLPGVYTFRFTGTNASGTAFDDTNVTVSTMSSKPNGVVVNPGNFAPVNAGALEDAVSDASDLTWDESGDANASVTYTLPPIGIGTSYVLTFRGRFSTTPVVPVRVELLMGSTVIKSTDLTVGTTLASQTMTLTSGEVAAITDRTVLRVRVSKVG